MPRPYIKMFNAESCDDNAILQVVAKASLDFGASLEFLSNAEENNDILDLLREQNIPANAVRADAVVVQTNGVDRTDLRLALTVLSLKNYLSIEFLWKIIANFPSMDGNISSLHSDLVEKTVPPRTPSPIITKTFNAPLDDDSVILKIIAKTGIDYGDSLAFLTNAHEIDDIIGLLCSNGISATKIVGTHTVYVRTDSCKYNNLEKALFVLRTNGYISLELVESVRKDFLTPYSKPKALLNCSDSSPLLTSSGFFMQSSQKDKSDSELERSPKWCAF